ncbi:hypothetical protein Peur_056620 [Populus x canadensis]
MDLLFNRMFSSLFCNKEARILVPGLDNAGKTTILYRLQIGEVVSMIPMIKFNVETVQYNNIKFQVWDLVCSRVIKGSSQVGLNLHSPLFTLHSLSLLSRSGTFLARRRIIYSGLEDHPQHNLLDFIRN